jgi:single-stranded-DNA-specific exonuclease
LLDLAAIGLVGDSSPMIGATRTMVRNGMICLRGSRRPGIKALFQPAKIDPQRLRSADIAMRLAPRINAPGRMAKPDLALELLLAPDDAAARRLMQEVEAHNQGRRGETDAMFAAAVDRIEAEALADGRRVLVVTGDAWRHGVVGLVAGRLARHYDRPVLLLAAAGDELRGSARSVDGFDITAALHDAGRLLRRCGGHHQAAGLELAAADLGALTERLEAAVRAAGLGAPQPNAIRIAADLPVERFDLPTARLVESLEPFGAGFPEPTLRLRRARVRFADRIGADRRHLRIKIATPGGLADVLCWGGGDRAAEALGAGWIDVVGRIAVNEWGGRRSVQLVAEDFRPSGAAAANGGALADRDAAGAASIKGVS